MSARHNYLFTLLWKRVTFYSVSSSSRAKITLHASACPCNASLLVHRLHAVYNNRKPPSLLALLSLGPWITSWAKQITEFQQDEDHSPPTAPLQSPMLLEHTSVQFTRRSEAAPSRARPDEFPPQAFLPTGQEMLRHVYSLQTGHRSKVSTASQLCQNWTFWLSERTRADHVWRKSATESLEPTLKLQRPMRCQRQISQTASNDPNDHRPFLFYLFIYWSFLMKQPFESIWGDEISWSTVKSRKTRTPHMCRPTPKLLLSVTGFNLRFTKHWNQNECIKINIPLHWGNHNMYSNLQA